MEEAESNDPKQEMKWRAFRSRHHKPAGPTEFVFGAVMGLPVPVPAVKEEDGRSGGQHNRGGDKAWCEEEEGKDAFDAKALPTLPSSFTALAQPRPFPRMGIGASPAGCRFWLLAGVMPGQLSYSKPLLMVPHHHITFANLHLIQITFQIQIHSKVKIHICQT